MFFVKAIVVLTLSSVSLTITTPVVQDVAPAPANDQQPHITAPIAATTAFTPPTWQDDSGSEHSDNDNDYGSSNGSNEDGADVALTAVDDALVDSILALLSHHWMAVGDGARSMERTAWERDGDEELVEYVVGPMRAQLLREVDAKVRIIEAQVRVAIAMHRVFMSSF